MSVHHTCAAVLLAVAVIAGFGFEIHSLLFWVAPPTSIAAFGSVLLPPLLERERLRLPILNRLGVLLFICAAAALAGSIVQTERALELGNALEGTPSSMNAWRLLPLALIAHFAAIVAIGISFAATASSALREGFPIRSVPFVLWTIAVAWLLVLISLAPPSYGAVSLLLDLPSAESSIGEEAPILWTHLFWTIGPEVYVLLLPIVGLVIHWRTQGARRVQ